MSLKSGRRHIESKRGPPLGRPNSCKRYSSGVGFAFVSRMDCFRVLRTRAKRLLPDDRSGLVILTTFIRRGSLRRKGPSACCNIRTTLTCELWESPLDTIFPIRGALSRPSTNALFSIRIHLKSHLGFTLRTISTAADLQFVVNQHPGNLS